jgi:hypothetical protein
MHSLMLACIVHCNKDANALQQPRSAALFGAARQLAIPAEVPSGLPAAGVGAGGF